MSTHGEQNFFVADQFGNAICFGPGSDGRPGPTLGDRERATVAECFRDTLPGSAAMAASIWQQSRTIRLAPESARALRTAQTVTKDGYALGVLQNSGGQFTHIIRFVPLGVAGAAAAALPVFVLSMQMASMQRQLAAIEDLVRENTQLTQQVLDFLQTQEWAEARAHWDAVRAAWREAEALGAVTDLTWQHIQSQGSETILRRQRLHLLHSLHKHADAIATTRSNSTLKTYLRKHQQTILGDAWALLLADDAWFTYQALRIGHLATRATTEVDTTLRAQIVDQALADRDEFLAQMLPVLSSIQRAYGLQSALHRHGTKGKQYQSVVTALSQAAECTEITSLRTPQPLAVPIKGIKKRFRGRVNRVVPWLLQPGDHVRMAARMSKNGWSGSSGRIFPKHWRTHGFAFLTGHELVIAEDDQLVEKGRVRRRIPLNRVLSTKITRKHGAMGGPNLKVRYRRNSKKRMTIKFDAACSVKYVKAFERMIVNYTPTALGPTPSELAAQMRSPRATVLAQIQQRSIPITLGRVSQRDAEQLLAAH